MSIIGTLLDVGSSLLSAKSNKKALNQVAGYATQSRDENNALAGDLYGQAGRQLQPYQQAGQGAFNALYNQAMGGPDWNGYLSSNPDVAAEAQKAVERGEFSSPQAFAQMHYSNYGQTEGRQLPTTAASFGPDVGARPTYERPSYEAAPSYDRPSFSRSDMGPLDVSLGAYQESPDLQFQMDRGLGALKSDKSLGGLLHTGAAVKDALGFSQDLAMGDYGQWRDYTTGQYNLDRARQDALFESDRGYGSGAFESDRGYGTSLYLNNRDRSDNLFELDRGYGTDVYNQDRDYATGRYDARNNLLSGIADTGYNATGRQIGAGQDYYSAYSGNNNAYASTMSDVALGKAANRNALYGQIPKAYAGIEDSFGKAFGLPGGSSGGGSPASSYYMQAASNNFLRRA